MTRRVFVIVLTAFVGLWAGAGVAQANPPVNIQSPSISPLGGVTQGTQLTLTPGTWDTSTTSVSDVWMECDSAGAGCRPISPAPAGEAYTVGSGDLGQTIEVQETATNSGDSPASTTTAISNLVGPVDGYTAVPTISGGSTAQQGFPLSLTQGSWTGSPTITDIWERCTSSTGCAAVHTGASYTPRAGDVGRTIRVIEIGDYAAGSVTATSLPTSPVIPTPVPTSSTAPAISGITWAGQTLTASTGAWTNSPTSYTYAWQRCGSGGGGGCTPIAGATGAEYVLQGSDVGHAITVQVIADNAGGNSSPASSAATAAVTLPLREVSAPTINGTPQQGQTLTEDHAAWNLSPVTYAYQWYYCAGSPLACAPIPGANGPGYQLTAADVGSRIETVETASSGGGGVSAVSGLTPVVTNATGIVTVTTSTSLTASPAAPVAGETVTLIATVTSTGHSVPPSGVLSFSRNGAKIGGCANLPVSPTGQSVTVTCPTTFTASSVGLTAAFTPTAGSITTASSSPVANIVIRKGFGSTSLIASGRADLDARTTYTAAVRPPVNSNGTIGPTGTATFLDAGRPISGCLSQPVFRELATCAVTYRELGGHRISVRYNGDGNYDGSGSQTTSVTVRPAPPTGYVTSFLSWSFYYARSYTKITNLVPTGLSSGITLSIRCTGHGCPFARHNVSVAKRCTRKGKRANRKCLTPRTLNLTPIFRGRHLGNRAQVTVMVSHAGWVGKYYRFSIRSGRKPRILESCLAVDSTRPGVGCTGQ